MKRLLSYLLLLLFIYSCAEIKSIPVKGNSINDTGFYYALPKTYLNIAVKVQKITVEKGFYFEYAKCVGFPESYLDKIPKKKMTIFKVKEATITNNVYLDKSKIYSLDVNQKFLNKSEFTFEFAKNGELASSEITNENQIVPAIITTANIVKDIAGAASFLGYNNLTLDNSYCDSLPKYVTYDIGRINDINTSINTLLEKGPEGLSKEQLEYRLKVLNDYKNEIISKFTKTVKVETATINFEVDPSTISSKATLFKYNKTKGFQRVYNKNPHNSKIPIVDKMPFHSDAITPSDTSIELQLVYLNKTDLVNNETNNLNNQASFYYRVPAQAKFKVMIEGKNIGEATLAVPQEGIVVGAPSNLRNINFKLHPGLGSLYTVSGKSSVANYGELDSLRKTLFTNKNEKTIKDLETKIKIRDLEKELEGVVDVESEEVVEEELEENGN